jgi:hypothetical protein
VVEQSVPLLGVVSVAGCELVDEPERVDNADVFGKQANGLMIHFTERSLHSRHGCSSGFSNGG